VNISLHDVTTSWTPTTVTWPNPDFSTTASNSQSVNRFSSTNPAADLYSWSSSMMIQDVQNWLDNPSSNFGWLVQGDESDAMSVRRFALGSPLTTGTGPMLEVEYSPVPEPASLTLFGLGALGLAGLVWRKRSAGSLPGM